jgi:hypothetical protein
MVDASVVCRQLGFPAAAAIFKGAHFGEGSGDVAWDNINCWGNEQKVYNCIHGNWGESQCGHERDVGIVCQTVRLSNGRGMHEGRVEVYHGGVWGTVCSVGWDFSDGEVVCRELGFPGVRQVYTSLRAPRFGEGSGLVWLEKAGCEGNETSLSSCRNPGWANHRCTHVEDAGVLCKVHPVRLANGSSEYEGRVELNYNGTWGAVCREGWDIDAARVVCRELGYQGAIHYPGNGYFARGEGPIWMDGVNCNGDETSISGCEHKGFRRWGCEYGDVAGVVCFALDVEVTSVVDTSAPSLHVSWTGVSGELIKYTVCYSTDAGTHSQPPASRICSRKPTSGASTILRSLSPGTVYYVWVRADWNLFVGEYSHRVSMRTYGAPSKVAGLSVLSELELGSPLLRVSWKEPAYDSRLIVDRYVLRYREVESLEWIAVELPSTSHAISHLAHSQSYEIQVRAESLLGSAWLHGEWSERAEESTFEAEASSVSTVDRVSAQWSEGQTVLRVTWEPVHTASLYIVQYSTHGGNVRMFNTTNTSFVITDVAYSDGLSLSVTYEENNKDGESSSLLRDSSTLFPVLIGVGCAVGIIVCVGAIFVGVVIWRVCCRKRKHICTCSCAASFVNPSVINVEKDENGKENENENGNPAWVVVSEDWGGVNHKCINGNCTERTAADHDSPDCNSTHV